MLFIISSLANFTDRLVLKSIQKICEARNLDFFMTSSLRKNEFMLRNLDKKMSFKNSIFG
jgi:hypothetical protein